MIENGDDFQEKSCSRSVREYGADPGCLTSTHLFLQALMTGNAIDNPQFAQTVSVYERAATVRAPTPQIYFRGAFLFFLYNRAVKTIFAKPQTEGAFPIIVPQHGTAPGTQQVFGPFMSIFGTHRRSIFMLDSVAGI